MKNYLYIFFSLVIIACSSPNQENDTTKLPIPPPQTIMEDYRVISLKNGENNWGYQILKNDILFINQPHIPAIQGKNGFSSEEKALKTGLFIVKKLKNGIIPPTISKTELDSLKVLN